MAPVDNVLKKSDAEKDLLAVLQGSGHGAEYFLVCLLEYEPDAELLLDWAQHASSSQAEAKRFLFFLALSLSVYESEGVPTPWIFVLKDFFVSEGLNDLYEEFRNDYHQKKYLVYKDNDGFNFRMDKREITKALENKADKFLWSQTQRVEIIEEHLNVLFSPGQCDIIKSRVQGKVLTKTQQEIFSRHIKKKLLAILNIQVQEIAQTLVKRRKKTAPSSKEILNLVRPASKER